MIYCVVPEALAAELYDKLADYYREDPNVEVIVDRRGQGGLPGDHPPFKEKRRQRAKGSFPSIEAPPPPTRDRPAPARSRPKDPRHVRAVPTTTQAKVERALDLFNGSSHQRTIAGLARTLGDPFVSAQPDTTQGSQVSVVVAWELSWYRYRVDLGDEADPVMMLDKGEEMEQIDEGLREWNARLDADGRVLAGHSVNDGGSEA